MGHKAFMRQYVRRCKQSTNSRESGEYGGGATDP